MQFSMISRVAVNHEQLVILEALRRRHAGRRQRHVRLLRGFIMTRVRRLSQLQVLEHFESKIRLRLIPAGASSYLARTGLAAP
jgi:hypothetical protein